MALDFAQVDSEGTVTGKTVRLDPGAHVSIIHGLMPGEYPMLCRMTEYYDDVEYAPGELKSLEEELHKLIGCDLADEHRVLVRQMLELVLDSMRNSFKVEAIAD